MRQTKMSKNNFVRGLILVMGICWITVPAAELVKKEEFVILKEKNSQEFKEIAVSLAEIKNDIGHIQQDLKELKDLRRSIFDRMLDIILAGGLAFTGAKVLRKRNDKKNLASNNL